MGLHIQIPESCAVGPQLVRDNARWRKSLLLQKVAHQLQRGFPVSARLDRDIQNLAFTVDGSPQVYFLAQDRK